MKIFLHTRPDDSTYDWLNTDEDFDQIPRVGDFVCRKTEEPTWARVTFVLHFPKSAEASYAAEVYGVNVDHMEALKAI